MNAAHAKPRAPVAVRRALVSVSDKTGLAEFARALADRGVEIISTGGTAKAIGDAGVPVTPVESVTAFPEMMDGRVKTLHPMIHGALLGLIEKDDHAAAMREHGIAPIDLLCVSLYPFEATVAGPGATFEDAVENIDIGGPAMIRSAAKNAARVTVATRPEHYRRILEELEATGGATTLDLRLDLMREAFQRTAEYDDAIAAYLAERAGGNIDDLPETLSLRWTKSSELRYGENPHQRAALYTGPNDAGPSIPGAKLLHGKPLSYNNIADAAAALELVLDLAKTGRAAAAVIKHANPCGAATAPDPAAVLDLAMKGDPLAAFGGIVASSAPVTADAARRLTEGDAFLEVVAAPAFDPEAVTILSARWKNARLLETGDLAGARAAAPELKTIRGGALRQTADAAPADPAAWTHAAGPAPTPGLLAAAETVWIAAKHLRSNAVAIGGPAGAGAALFGAGAGQMDRVAACRNAVSKAGDRAEGAVAASDAFFPFPDGPEILIDAGVAAIVQPGGSRRDQATLDLCERRGVTCLLTGVRHFKH